MWGSGLLDQVEFPHAKVLGPDAGVEEIKALIAECGEVFIKPIFKGGVGKKGKAGLIGRAKDVVTALKEKERLFFAEHVVDNARVKADGVTFEGAVPGGYEIYFSITDSTRYRAPMMTISLAGGVAVEELEKDKIKRVPFDPLTGLKSFHIANALEDLRAPDKVIGPLVEHLPKLWDLFSNYGMATLELNPIRIGERDGRVTPIACDFKCDLDQDDPAWKRLGLPTDLLAADTSEFEREINKLRTYQGQSDVFIINDKGTITAPTFGGGANAMVSELLGDAATISSDFGGNPPYGQMREISEVLFKYWMDQTNVLFIIGGKANSTDIYETFRGIADALRLYFQTRGPRPLFVVVGRGGPNLIRGMAYLRDTLEALGLPYRIFGHDSPMSEVIGYALAVNDWMIREGREQIRQQLQSA
jgi:succinyl-CoA synthetase beta subunit